MKLEDTIQLPLKLKISSTGKEYTLRFFNLMDNVWLKEVIGEKDYTNLFDSEKISIETLVKIIYNQIEDKEDFKMEEIKSFDQEGNQISVKIGGYKKLLNIINSEEINNILCIFYELHFKSHPDLESDKKKVTEIAKKYLSNKIGQK